MCRMAGVEERICGSDGRFHTTSSKVIQPIVEPVAMDSPEGKAAAEYAKQHPPAVTWEMLDALDKGVADRLRELGAKYGYHADPMLHPQLPSTHEYKA
jgi:hypothetical protein